VLGAKVLLNDSQVSSGSEQMCGIGVVAKCRIILAQAFSDLPGLRGSLFQGRLMHYRGSNLAAYAHDLICQFSSGARSASIHGFNRVAILAVSVNYPAYE
jgi:hypothetical protein